MLVIVVTTFLTVVAAVVTFGSPSLPVFSPGVTEILPSSSAENVSGIFSTFFALIWVYEPDVLYSSLT